MVLTRSASSSPVKKFARPLSKESTSPAVTTTSATKLEPSEPLRIVILPKTITSAARFLSLSNPIDQTSKRYLFCPTAGLFELTRTGAPKHEPRSILFTPQDIESTSKRPSDAVSHGYVNQTAEYLTATPYDVSFTLIPLLTNSSKSDLFQTLDDILDTSDDEVYDLAYVFRHSRALLEEAASHVCDLIEASDETLYRYSQPKTLRLLIAKSKRACDNGLPASLEERFVTRILETPMLSVKREESTTSLTTPDLQDKFVAPSTPAESFDSQSTTTSTAPSIVFSEASTVSTSDATEVSSITIVQSAPSDGQPVAIVALQRLLTAFRFIVHSYLPIPLASSFLASLQDSSSGIDFSPLTDHLAYITKLRAEAAAAIDLSSFSRKRGIEDSFQAEERAEKKKRLEEEEKRKKAAISRGVKDLAKVDVKGMKKMSSFFTKLPTKGKS